LTTQADKDILPPKTTACRFSAKRIEAMPKPRLFACLLVGAIVSPLGCTTPQSGSPTNVPEMSNALAPLDVDPALEATPPVAATQPWYR